MAENAVEPTEESPRRDALDAARQALLEQRLRGLRVPVPADAGIPRRPATAGPVLSPGQERLWFLHQLEPGSAAYNLSHAVRIEGPLDPAALERSLEAVVRRHEVLRTAFPTVDGRASPVIVSDLRVPLARLDLTTVPAEEREERARERVDEEARRPFDLAVAPLLRAMLLRLGEADHVLLVTMHHIVADEWSLEVFWREVTALYAAALAGGDAGLPELPLQYADYAYWQRSRLEAPELERQLAYWRDRLGGEQPVLQLPADHPRPARQSFRGGHESLTLSPRLSDALASLARTEGVTRFVLLLAAFQTLLHRYTGETDIRVGTPATARSRTGLEALIGFFLNTLVLRADLGGDPGFREVTGRARQGVLEALANQEVPFEAVVGEVKPERRLGHNPLFQVMFVLQRDPPLPALGPGLRSRPFPVRLPASKFDLTLFAREAPHGIELMLEYASDQFERGTVRRMLGHLAVLLQGIVDHPDRPISRLPLLSEAERHQLLQTWSSTAVELPPATRIHRLFEARVELTPDADAVVFDDQVLSYGELDRRSAALARRLRALGVGADVCVGLCAERSLEMLVGILGILKAGGAYVPLDPDYPQARLFFMLEDTRAPVVLAQRRLVERVPRTGAAILAIEDAISPTTSGDPLEPAATPDNLAYVIHTSGSTGRPKGVPVTHRNLEYSTRARLHHYPGVPERFLLLPSFAFDSSVAGIFWTLCTGGTLVLPRRRLEQDVGALAGLIARQRVTHTLCLPSLYELLLAHADPHELRSLRTVIVAGEACPTSVVRRHRERLPGARLHNEYGPTEATVWCTVFDVPEEFAGARVPIGRPVAEVRAYVLDPHRQPVPIGVPGELYVGGPGVTGGYLHRPDETSARFQPDPFSMEPGARLYRTGDLVRWLADGNLEFLGRVDQQVKIRGHRIELGEIEAALNLHPAVRESVVVARGTAGTHPGSAATSDIGADVEALVDALLALEPFEAERFLAEVEQLHPVRRTAR